MNIRFYNARILTMVDGEEIIQNGELHVRGDRITYVGENEPSEKRTKQWDRKIDVKGNLLMPGFKNAYGNSAMAFLRSHADDMKLRKGLGTKLTGEDVYDCTQLAVLEYLTSGITSVCDTYLNYSAAAKAMKDSGMRCVMCGAVTDDDDKKLESLKKDFEKYNREDSLVRFAIGIGAEYACSKDFLEKISKLVNDLKTPVYTHCAETEQEVKECIERYGMTPAMFFESLGLFNYGAAVFHGVHVNDEDLEMFKKRGISVVTDPASNAKTSSGTAPIVKYMQNGLNIGIGTDGPAGNNCPDMFREMFLISTFAKLNENCPSPLDAADVLKMATSGGAKAIGLDECDCLKAGKKADIVMIDMYAPNMQPLYDIKKSLVYAGSKSNVKMTMINGKILYEDGKFNIGVSPEEVYRHVEKVCERMFKD